MRKHWIILLITLLLILLSGCGADGVRTQTAGETRTVTDCLGRSVEIPADPQRVACLYASTAHMMAMLGEEEKITGCPRNVKSETVMQLKYPDIADVSVPFQEGSINVEELLRADTDLVLLRYTVAAREAEVEKLDEAGIPYLVIDYMNMGELENAITIMGQVFRDEKEAGKYLQFSRDTINMVKERLADVPEKNWPVVYHSVNEAVRTDDPDSICNEIMRDASVRDCSVYHQLASQGEKTYTTLEEIYRWNPDAVLANEASVTEYILTDSKWAGLDAVREGAVYTLPVGATRWCHPGSMEPHMAVLSIAKRFYPDRFEDIDLKEYTKKYYEEYFGLSLNEEMLDSILSGRGMRKANDPLQ